MELDNVIAARNDKVVYRDGDIVIKVFGASHSKADVLSEAVNHALVEETSINVPCLREVRTFDGKWAIVSDYISGSTLDMLIKEHPEKHDEYLELFVDIQMLIHRQSCPTLGKLKDKMSRLISLSGLDATTRYDLHTRLEGMPTHNKLCHGNLDLKNIIIREDGKAFVLDWEHASQGNASADAARTYLLFWLMGDVDSAEKYMKLFCKKSDTAKQYVQKWIPIVAASQSVRSKPEERDSLLYWVNLGEHDKQP